MPELLKDSIREYMWQNGHDKKAINISKIIIMRKVLIKIDFILS